LEDLLPKEMSLRSCYLSGPNFAREVAMKLPSATTVASRSEEGAKRVQALLTRDYLRVYTHHDVIGIELGGAVKNVIAIAAGISDGLGLGHNARAALITRGISEMTRLGIAMGASAETFAGLSGMGDLVLTCTGDLSRNRKVGMWLAEGLSLDDILSREKTVAEGVRTSKSVMGLAQKHGVEMPICREVYRVLHEGKPPTDAVGALMGRTLKKEFSV
jgi:glycerol-3-phosphate dehydrogenase (NAD(P)+)